MNLKDWAKKVTGFRLGTGSAISVMELPPNWNYQQYLSVYGEVGWLFGAVDIISNAVAEAKWHLFVNKNGDKEEIDNHVLLDMWRYVNPFQTKYQFVQLAQMYLSLVGEAFIVLNFNKLGVPAEMWLAPPQFMHIIPHPETYISHYEYRRGMGILRLEVPEVIHIFNPNPYNPYRGMGAAQSIGVDLDSERYAARYTQRLFYNDATPGMIIEYPEIPEKSERELIRKEWDEIHRGWRNARKTGFLWGGAKANTLAMTNRDMDFWRLRKINRETILGAYHIPTSMMGLAEVGSRARAEADEYIFAKYTVRPALTRIMEALNEQLVPLYDDKLTFEFEDPVPENRVEIVDEIAKLVPVGIITREEGRQKLGYDPEPAKGETLLEPMNLLPTEVKSIPDIPYVKAFSEEQKEVRWRTYIVKSQRDEVAFKRSFKKLWDAQANTVADNYEQLGTLDQAFDTDKFQDDFDKGLSPAIQMVFAEAMEQAVSGDNARSFHKQDEIPDILNQQALEWIRTRSLRLAQMVNGTTKEELRKVLAEGFAEGESVPQLKRRIKEYYKNGYERRATIIARTEVISASNEGALQGYEREGIQKSEFYPAPDACDICLGFVGVYPISESHGIITDRTHPNCRCVWLPVVE